METWKDVAGWEGMYQVSDQGKIRSLDRTVIRRDGKVKRFRGKDLKLNGAGNHGYLAIKFTRNSSPHFYLVHRLVLTAFVRPGKGSEEGCHDDGNKRNNVVTNLRWGSREENCKDRIRHGVNGKKLVPSDIRKVRRLRKKGWTQHAIGAEVGVSPTMVGNILRGDSWFNV